MKSLSFLTCLSVISVPRKVPIGDALLELRDCVMGSETCEEIFAASSPHTDMWLNGGAPFIAGHCCWVVSHVVHLQKFPKVSSKSFPSYTCSSFLEFSFLEGKRRGKSPWSTRQ